VSERAAGPVGAQIAVCALYVVTGWMGLALAIPPGNVTPVWLPGGIALAALLVRGVSLWPAIFAGAALLNASFYLRSGAGWGEVVLASALIATGSTLQALAGRALLVRFAGTDVLATPRKLIALAVLEVPACLVAATLGLATLRVFGRVEEGLELKTWVTWWLGDYVGMILVAPVVLAIRDGRAFEASWLERALFALAVLATTELVFAPLGLGGQLPAPHFLLPVLAAGAYHLGPRETAIGALATYLGAALGTAEGHGPFVTMSSPLLATDGLLFALALPALLLAVAEAERRRAASALQETHERLEQSVAERTRALARANAELAHRVTEEARLVAQVERAQRVESTGRLAGGMAHDFNNFLTVVISATELLRDRRDVSAEARELADTILEAAHHAAGLTRQLLLFAGRQPGEPTDAPVGELVAQHLALLRPVLPADVHLHVELDASPRVRIDTTQVGQLLVNLALNACDAMPDGGTLTLRTLAVELPDPVPDEGWIDATPQPGPHAVIEVADTGVGMDEETRRRAFEPFFTTKRVGGSGLGLASVLGIVRQAAGAIALRTTPGGGSTFRIHLPSLGAAEPAARPSTPARAPSGDAPSTHAGSLRVLFVEDEPALRRLGARLLEGSGHRVRTAGSAEEALALAEVEVFDVLVTDVVMPGQSGVDLARALRAKRPTLPVVLVSGYTADELRDAPREVVLTKPFAADELREAIALACARSAVSG
jgi:signal transduction histidine kinase